MKINRLFWVLLILIICSVAVEALSKPIGGRVQSDFDFKVVVLAEVEMPWGENQICVTNPFVSGDSDGSFATDLFNLVMKDFPSVRCNSFWKAGDLIWYEIFLNGQTYVSNKEVIEPGTVAQIMGDLLIVAEQVQISPESSAAGGRMIEGEKTLPEIETILSFIRDGGLVDVELFLELLSGAGGGISSKLVLFSMPNEDVVKVISDNFILETSVEKHYRINTSNLEDGWYQLQSFVYVGGKLVGISNREDFFIKKVVAEEVIEEKETPQLEFLEIVYKRDSGLALFLILIIIILLIVIGSLLKKKGS